MSKRTAFWLAWSTWVLYVVIAIVDLLLQIKDDPSGWLSNIFNALVLLAFATVGSLIASRRPQNPIGWLFCISTLLWALGAFMLDYTTYAFLTVPVPLPAGALLGVFGDWARGMGSFLMLTFLLLLFPNGHLPSPRWRFLAWLIAGLLAAYSIALLLSPFPYANIDSGLATVRNPLGILVANDLFDRLANYILLLVYLTVLACIISVVLRFRRARGEERQQLKWFAYGMTLSILMLIVIIIAMLSSTANSGFGEFFFLAVIGIPISAGIAILRYRLYDIDVLINRTLVYSLLTFLVVSIYVLIVGGLGTALQVQGNLMLSLVATGLIALLFQPLRIFLQRTINRLLYGQRDEPYAVISRLGSRLEATLAPDAVLPTIVETVAQALKLPYAAIALQHDQASPITASYGIAGEPLLPLLHLPLLYQSEHVGELLLAPRARGESFTPADRRLLDDLARQVGIAAHAVRLTADLQLSRERLVRAREEERRRLRRDLHDGLGPTLATITVKAEAARDAIAEEPAQATLLLEELIDQAQAAITDIRRLVYNLRPPALDDLGFVAAIRAQATHFEHPGLRVNVEAPNTLPELPAAVEVAAYRIVQEALTNVVHHANARSCLIRLTFDAALHLSVTDDGCGIPVDRQAGVGLRSMQERAVELGGSCSIETLPAGGTQVVATLPCILIEAAINSDNVT